MLKGIRPAISRDLIHSYAAMLAPRSREGFGGYHVEMSSLFHLPPHRANARSSGQNSRTPREPFKNNMTARDATEDTELMSCEDVELIPNLGRTFSPSNKCTTVVWALWNYPREITSKFNFSQDNLHFAHRIGPEASVPFHFASPVGFLTREYARWSRY